MLFRAIDSRKFENDTVRVNSFVIKDAQRNYFISILSSIRVRGTCIAIIAYSLRKIRTGGISWTFSHHNRSTKYVSNLLSG